MSLTTLDIKPDRLLMDSNFDGYRLSLEELKLSRKELDVPVDKTFLNSSQYGILHAKLFGLHNHLFGDRFDNYNSVYFIDNQLNVKKTYVDTTNNELIDPVTVFTISKNREKKTGDYNVTLQFACPNYAVISDGMGNLIIVATKDKRDDDEFEPLFMGKVLSNEEQGFIITDAHFNEIQNELHVLLLHIQEDTKDRFVSVIHWITFRKSDTWGQVAMRQLKTKGEVQYLHFEKNCNHIYIVSDHDVTFTLNSEHPIETSTTATVEKMYKWSQNLEEITIKLPLPENAQKHLIQVTTDETRLQVTYNGESKLSGDLEGKVDPSLMTWSLNNDVLEVVLNKKDEGLFWKQLIDGDDMGEYVVDSCIVEQVNERLQGLTSETEAIPQAGTTFNSQQIEECDFETDKSETFDRISGVTSKATHRVHLGSHQVLLSPYLSSDGPPALGIRHDVDVCLWQPMLEGEEFQCKHEGTLLAFGYVQASKTNRKFLTCSPNMNYAVVSESCGHIFIYRQNKPVSATELRHRGTGRRVRNMAQQQVFNLPNQDILGLYAGNGHLFVLGEKFVIALNICPVSTD